MVFRMFYILFLTLCAWPKDCLTYQTREELTFLINGDTDCIGVEWNRLDGPGIKMYDCLAERVPQWFFSNGSLQWEANRTHCLVPNCEERSVTLGHCSLGRGKWERSVNKSIQNTECANLVLTRGYGESQNISLDESGDLARQEWLLISDLKAELSTPPLDTYLRITGDAFFRRELLRSLVNAYTPLSDPLPYPRDIKTFPGTVMPWIPRVSQTIALRNNWQNPNRFRIDKVGFWQPTELYAAAGDIVSVVLPTEVPLSHAEALAVRIGAHTDVLTPKTRNSTKAFYRMPIVSEVFPLLPGVNRLRSQYGGNLIFMFRKGTPRETNVTVENVVEAPYFELNVTNHTARASMRYRYAPQAVLVGENFVLITDAGDAKEIKKLSLLLRKYENVISLANNYSGFNTSDLAPGRLWIVNDETERGGSHSGFPVVMESSLHSLSSKKTPMNETFRNAIGSFYNQPCWAEAFHSQVLANLFGLYVHEKMDDIEESDLWEKRAHKNIVRQKPYDTLSPANRLVFFADIVKSFGEKGWEAISHLHRTTRTLTDKQVEEMKAEPQRQRDYVYSTLSTFLEYDLSETFQSWGIIKSSTAAVHVSQQVRQTTEEPEATPPPMAFGDYLEDFWWIFLQIVAAVCALILTGLAIWLFLILDDE